MTVGEYPHLDDTGFPDASGVDVYKYGNSFDYQRWSANVELKLCSVPWESDGRHAVKFDDDAARDAWFDAQQGSSVAMETMFHTLPSKADIRVPLPYDVCTAYNYMRVKVPVMPSAGEPLEYADSPKRYAYQHWFVRDVETLAPSTTKLVVQRDWWTDFVNHVDISHMMLERGHAPMPKVTVEDYLGDPINHTAHLGAPDVDFGGNSIVTGNEYAPIGNGEKWVLFFTNMEQADWTDSRKAVYVGDYDSDVSYADKTVDSRPYRNYDIEWNWDYGDFAYRDGSHHAITAFTDHRANRVSNNVGVVAVKASDVHQGRGDDGADFLNSMRVTYPQWFQTVFGICNVSRDMIELEDHKKVTLNFVTSKGKLVVNEWDVYRAVPQSSDLLNLKLDASMFKMPSRYAKVTKLYTSPYSHLEMVGADGHVTSINVEDVHNVKSDGEVVANIQLKQRPILSFPWVVMTAFLRGVGGDASSQSYTWKNLGGSESEYTCYGDAWKDTILQYRIPVFALYQSSYDKYRLDNYSSSLEYGKYSQDRAYENAADVAGTSYFNLYGNGGHSTATFANDSFSNDHAADDDIGTAFTSQENAYASAKAARMNASDAADTGKTNASNVQQGSNENANTAWTASTNGAIISSNASVNVTGNNLVQAYNENAAQLMFIEGMSNLDMSYTGGLQVLTGKQNALNIAVGGMAGLAGAVNGGPQAGISAISGMASSMVNAETAWNSASLILDKQDVTRQLNEGITKRKFEIGVKNANDNSTTMHGMRATVNGSGLNHSYGGRTGDAVNGANYLITKNYADGARTQALRSANVAKAAADASLDTSKANAERSEDASQWVAKNTRHTARFNAGKSYSSALRTASRKALSARQSALSSYRDAHRQGQLQYGSYSGEAQWDALRMRGVQFRVMRQSDGAISAAGDEMLRWGYRYKRAWAFEGFNVMAKFTYWECSDVWLTSRSDGMVEEAQDAIKGMLYKGVTVWHNPDEVGAVSIYQNWGE